MNPVFDVMREELNRLERLKASYEHKVEQLPRGTISLKVRGTVTYAYLARRVENKVKFQYIGRTDSPLFQELGFQIMEKKAIERKIKDIKNDIKDIKRALRD